MSSPPVTASPLDPDADALLTMWHDASAGPIELQPLEALRNSGLINPTVTGPKVEVERVSDRVATGSNGHEVGVRVYEPGADEAPVLVYAHGGGWTLLSVESCDALCRRISAAARCTVVSVDYRLAPEHPFPAAYEDMWCAVEWVAHGGLGSRPSRIAVGGDSAGGNLAAAVALAARDSGTIRLSAQLLLYPATDTDLDTPSMRSNGADPKFRLSPPTMRWFWGNYLRGDLSCTDERAVPARAASHAGLAPAIVVAPKYDPLHSDAVRYAGRLEKAGTPVDLIEPPTMPHGFAMLIGAVPSAAPIVDDVIGRLGAALHTEGGR
ncbi:MAG: alpha/beta hydrolase [Actinobacteria bacterium]|nr:alpha/beta hydrolase [Actinomycetota bacterium]